MKTLDLRRWPRANMSNAYLVVLAVMLAGTTWMLLTEGEWGPILVVGAVAFFWVLVALHRTDPRRLRLEITADRLRVLALQGSHSEVLHDLVRSEIRELWLREQWADAFGLVRGTAGRLSLMARTPEHDALELIPLRDAHLELYDQHRLLDWLTEHLKLGRGM